MSTRPTESPSVNPKRITDWEAQSVHILRSNFGLQQFRKGQLAILRSVLSRRDTLAVMPTGGGKSLCFQLPALYFQQKVVVISPLIALMKDQVQRLQKLDIPAACLHSGMSAEEKRQVFERLDAEECFLLYLSPERVQRPGISEWLLQQNVALFAIDEAHCLSQWGPDFRKDYYRLNVLRKMRPDVPILALTATATPQALDDIQFQLGMRQADRHVYGFYRSNLFYHVIHCVDESAKQLALNRALTRTKQGRVLIYCGTRRQCEILAQRLRSDWKGVGYYHAGLTAEERNQVQRDVETGQIRILAATNAFGMGVDYPDVRLVIHYQIPANLESYYQEIGRAGRDGQAAHCLLLYTRKDRGLQAFFIRRSSAQPEVIRRRWDGLEAMTRFVEDERCRHSAILTYFNDTEKINECGHCDVCKPGSLGIERESPVLHRRGFQSRFGVRRPFWPRS